MSRISGIKTPTQPPSLHEDSCLDILESSHRLPNPADLKDHRPFGRVLDQKKGQYKPNLQKKINEVTKSKKQDSDQNLN